VFVDIVFDVSHCVSHVSLLLNEKKRISLIGTIQYNSCIHEIRRRLKSPFLKKIPQLRPLSPGEVLGCTSPKIRDTDIVVYIGDGRFHLESVMIQNPTLEYHKYCPFTRKMTKEEYDYNHLIKTRRESKAKFLRSKNIGVILGTLGRQGNPAIHRNLVRHLEERGYCVYTLVMNEINENSLDSFCFIDAFVQVSCPRLSIDWGAHYKKPLLGPFEVFNELDEYKMDYYSKEENSPWKNN
jgi:2-(3-amino-3-carboxypropyl)histidine synthase